jgi:hypothetical protein
MKIPKMTAEFGIGPALHSYASAPGAGDYAGDVTQMGFLDDLTGVFGNILSGITTKIPCLIGCGIPNALAIAPECGFDPACWIAQGGSAAFDCISKCLT